MVDYYVNRGSRVFACFIDFKKAFDYVNYWKLFTKLLQDNTDSNIVGMLVYWYSHQELCVRWISSVSGFLWQVMVPGKVVFFLRLHLRFTS